jgi:hypothetical protein
MDGLGDCHDIAMALMTDLSLAGAAEGWAYVLGGLRTKNGVIEHSWLEFDGWAVDAANGKCLVVPSSTYPAAKIVRRMPRDEFAAWLAEGAPHTPEVSG